MRQTRSRLEKLEALLNVNRQTELKLADKQRIEAAMSWAVTWLREPQLNEFEALLGRQHPAGQLSEQEEERLAAYCSLIEETAALPDLQPAPPVTMTWPERQAAMIAKVRSSYEAAGSR